MSEHHRILIVGGTGLLGKPVVDAFVADGNWSVRVLTRRPPTSLGNSSEAGPVEYAKGDLFDPISLRSAMDDCVALHINLSGGASVESRGAEAIAAELPSSSIQRISLISGITTNAENAQRFEFTQAKWDAEEAIRKSGVSYTIFRCTIFLESLPKYVHTGLIGSHHTQWHWLAAHDYARMVLESHSLTPKMRTATHNQTFFLLGPGPPKTLPEAIQDYYIPSFKEAELHCPMIPRWLAMWYALLDKYIYNDPERADMWWTRLKKMDWLSSISELGDPSEANELLGAPSITLRDWCQRQARSQN